ncbi:MAG: PilN domain-containing protein [Thermodesulfovibrionales bacterium]|nr:PilN domain-containing protein [Thermodesulfovibrionales bacterium]
MIRINLLPTKRKKKTQPVATYLVTAGVVTLVFIALAFFANSYMGSRIDDLEATSAQNKRLLVELDKKIKEVKDFEAINKKFMDRKKVIEELTAGQSLPVRILDELSMKLTDGVWLKTLSIKNEKVSLAAMGFNNSEIVDFVQDLKGSELFKEVVLLGTTKAVIDDVEVFNFNISFVVGS